MVERSGAGGFAAQPGDHRDPVSEGLPREATAGSSAGTRPLGDVAVAVEGGRGVGPGPAVDAEERFAADAEAADEDGVGGFVTSDGAVTSGDRDEALEVGRSDADARGAEDEVGWPLVPAVAFGVVARDVGGGVVTIPTTKVGAAGAGAGAGRTTR